VTLSEASVGRILHKRGLSPQRTPYRAYEQDPEKVAEWKDKTFPQIQARAKKEGAAIFFADESSVRTDFHAGNTWAPVGRTPCSRARGRGGPYQWCPQFARIALNRLKNAPQVVRAFFGDPALRYISGCEAWV
jgi:hypothetical protein